MNKKQLNTTGNVDDSSDNEDESPNFIDSSVTQDKKRICFFYQTFTKQNSQLRDLNPNVTDLIVSSIHFARDPVTKKPYMHLNDNNPDHFELLFSALDRLRPSVRVHVMIGGAGGGLGPLVHSPNIYYPMLKSFLRYEQRITGINIDVEEPGVSTSDVVSLVEKLHRAFPGFELSMAPVASPAPSGAAEAAAPDPPRPLFDFSAFVASPSACLVRSYMVQMYSDFTNAALEAFVQSSTGMRYEQVLVGTLSEQFEGRMEHLRTEYGEMLQRHPMLAGAFNWELFDVPDDWAVTINECNDACINEELYEWGMINLCPLL